MPTDWNVFRTHLLAWYRPERRPMPWKESGNPYHIWLSEIILQQTRVAQGLPYFERFIAAFPTVQSLAQAPDDQVMKLWEGLGYYSRARNLLRAARMVTTEYDGVFPDTYQELLKLTGVGPYTAAAIASFAFGEAVAVLDGNVFRVLSRYAGDAHTTEGTSGRNHFQQLADRALGSTNAARFNQAIMDFGALVCTPRNAACGSCPLAETCAARSSGRVYELPVKKKKQKVSDRYFHYLVITTATGETLIRQRREKDIWQDLYEYPLLEADTVDLRTRELLELPGWPDWLPADRLEYQQKSQVYRHVLSHQRIQATFHHFELSGSLKLPTDNLLRVPAGELGRFAFPRLLLRYREDSTLTLDL